VARAHTLCGEGAWYDLGEGANTLIAPSEAATGRQCMERQYRIGAVSPRPPLGGGASEAPAQEPWQLAGCWVSKACTRPQGARSRLQFRGPAQPTLVSVIPRRTERLLVCESDTPPYRAVTVYADYSGGECTLCE
jgi:hypothetical protein